MIDVYNLCFSLFNTVKDSPGASTSVDVEGYSSAIVYAMQEWFKPYKQIRVDVDGDMFIVRHMVSMKGAIARARRNR